MSIDPSHPPGDAPCPSCGSLIWFSAPPKPQGPRRTRILALARQIEELAQPSRDASVFFPGFLQRLLDSVNAPAGLIWLTPISGQLILLYERGLNLAGYHQNVQSNQLNQALLTEVCHEGKPQLFGSVTSSPLPTPTEQLYILIPLMAGKHCLGVLEVLQRPNIDPRARTGYQQFIEQMGGYAAKYIQERRSRGLIA